MGAEKVLDSREGFVDPPGQRDTWPTNGGFVLA